MKGESRRAREGGEKNGDHRKKKKWDWEQDSMQDRGEGKGGGMTKGGSKGEYKRGKEAGQKTGDGCGNKSPTLSSLLFHSRKKNQKKSKEEL